jgi:ribosome-binding ATPase
MALSIAIVGLPNVGKSTLFKALTKKEVDIANYPFCTIDPNVGVVEVPDDRLQKLAELSHSKKIIPAVVEFVDIAGLVKGASKGEGLGNQFLAHIRQTDAMLYVARLFADADIHHVEKTIDPIRDSEIIQTELALKDLETVEKRLASARKETKGTTGAAAKELAQEILFLEELQGTLNGGVGARTLFAKHGEVGERIAHSMQLLTAKPVLFVLNTHTPDNIPEELVTYIAQKNAQFIALNFKEENDAAGFSPQERSELGLGEPSLPLLVHAAYEVLGLITFLTTGEDETRAWTIPQGAKAPQAAGVIHTDFEQNFIRAEVIGWQDLMEAGSWAEARSKGTLRLEGKEYIVRDGDVMVVRHGG